MGAFNRKAEEAKVTKHLDHCKNRGWGFIPHCLNCWGGLGPSATALWEQILKRAVNSLIGKDRDRHSLQLRQSLSISLMREVGRQLEVAHLVQDPLDSLEYMRSVQDSSC